MPHSVYFTACMPQADFAYAFCRKVLALAIGPATEDEYGSAYG